jgi:transposase InsO family protein
VRDAELAEEVSRVWEESRRTYGSPRVFMQPGRDGVSTSEKRVARIMRERGWAGVSRRCAKSPDGKEKRVSRKEGAPDLVKRKFEADGPDQAWFADITYVRTYRGWPCLAIVMDIWSRRVVGWAMGDRIDARLADDALRMAIARRRPPEGCLHHSDHGSQYASLVIGKTMRDHGIRPSMGSVESPWDNAPTESLMGTIKSECVHAKTYRDREQAALEIFEYMECFHDRLRLHSALGYMSPCEFEEAYADQPLAA